MSNSKLSNAFVLVVSLTLVSCRGGCKHSPYLVEATCISEGYYVCEVCGERLPEYGTTPKKPHSYFCQDYTDKDYLSKLSCTVCGTTFNATNDNNYYGEITNESRFVALGFDDFRESDFSIIIPLLNENNQKATFNHISYDGVTYEMDKYKIDSVLNNKHELGDHTFYHFNYLFDNPFNNGQDPSHLDGEQEAFPTNEELKNNRGDGCNAFGYLLTDSVNNNIPETLVHDKRWIDLDEVDCQEIREKYALYSKNNPYLDVFDKYSNKYFGTQGSSFGSYDSEKGIYTGGIFTGCHTSANHEIWERLFVIERIYYAEQYGVDVKTWSWPGNYRPNYYYEKDGILYYDRDHKLPVNYLSRIEKINGDETTSRSVTDCLRKAGYQNVHDNIYPGRNDGQYRTMMEKQMYLNASLSKDDALITRTSSSIHYEDLENYYNEEFFEGCTSEEEKLSKMYLDKGPFYDCVEATRHNTANGMIHGEVIDTFDTDSERMFFKYYFDYCKKSNIELITKSQAFDICFNNNVIDINLIHNVNFKNTARDYIPSSNDIPTNPDGYLGDCEVYLNGINNERILRTNGKTSYIQYGIPFGTLNYSLSVKGVGSIKILKIYNSTPLDYEDSDLDVVTTINVNNDTFRNEAVNFSLSQNSDTDYEAHFGGLGNKIMGLKIIYSEGLEFNNVQLLIV